MQQRQRHLSLTYIVTGRFADIHFFEVVENIILDLETIPQILSELTAFKHQFLRSIRRNSTDLRAGRKQRSRLFLNHLHIASLVEDTLFGRFELLDLTLR